MAVKDYDRKRMIIVGGGLSAGFCLQHLANHLESMPEVAQHLQVEVVTDGPDLGTGIAWGGSATGDMHFINHYVKPEYRNFSDELMAKLTPRQKELIDGEEVPRAVEGMRMHEQYLIDVEKLKAMGVIVKQTPNTEVKAVSKMGDQYLVETPNVEKTADYLVLATGHWQGKSKSNSTPGVFSSPWPASKLQKEIDPNQTIAVMGTSLSGVDAMLTLAHNAGEFKKNEEGETIFVPKEGAEKYKIVNYSPSGMLPVVMGDNHFRGVGMSPPNLHDCVGPDGFVSLDKMYDVIRHDFLSRKDRLHSNDPMFQAIKEVLGNDDLNVEQAIEKLNNLYREAGPQKALEASLEAAKQSRKDRKPLIWQEYLHGIGTAVEYYHNYMGAEDYDRFMKHVRPTYAKHAAAIVQTNAEEILALMKQGVLEVKALGENSSVNTSVGKSGAEVRYKDADGEHAVHHDTVVKATGDDLQRLKDSTDLMKSLFNPREPLAHEVLHQYKDQGTGLAEFQREQKEGAQNLFLMGPPTKAYAPIFEGVGVMHRQAENITEAITDRLWQQIFPDRSPSAPRSYDDMASAAAAIYMGRGGPSRDQVLSLVTQMGGDGMSDMDIVLPEGVHPEVLERLQQMFRQYGGKDGPF